MVRRCCVPNCATQDGHGIRIFTFSKDGPRRESWLSIIRGWKGMSSWSPRPSHGVCMKHFGPDQWEKVRVDESRRLRDSGIPNIFICDENDENNPNLPMALLEENENNPNLPMALPEENDKTSMPQSPHLLHDHIYFKRKRRSNYLKRKSI